MAVHTQDPTKGRKPNSFIARKHDHRRCVNAALDAASAVCGRRGTRLTVLRQRVLELVWQSHEPVGAYALLDALRRDRQGAAPPTVYRALEFLLDHGLVHRIASLNAFVGCDRPARPHAGQFLICRGCGRAAEFDDAGVRRAIAASARKRGFEVGGLTVEVNGSCPSCAAPEPSHAG
jgi:Fur family zinc uptake transcriptional regulator